MIEICDLVVSLEGSIILDGLNLKTQPGQIHAIMGPNGAGKSTLAKVLAGDPNYEIESGSIYFRGEDITEMEPEERAHLGLFMSFQYPVEIPGITNYDFLFHAKKAHQPDLTQEEFDKLIEEKIKKINMNPSFLHRFVNDGFSGGEKKKNEILQMAVLDPYCAILDETDSGLDIDAMKIVAEGINTVMNENKTLILITHYQRLLDYVKPDFVHVMLEGKIVKTEGREFAQVLEKQGYDFLK